MSKKTIAFATPSPTTPKADDWVKTRTPEEEATKRFTVDVPLSLHMRVKIQCAMRGCNMADVLRQLLEREFPNTENA